MAREARPPTLLRPLRVYPDGPPDRTPAEVPDPTVPSLLPPPLDEAEPGGEPILVAHGDATTRALLGQLLLEAGHEVVGAGDGEGAVELQESRPVALALLDRRLPGLDGVQVCSGIRHRWGSLELPVALIGAGGDSPARAACRAAGGRRAPRRPGRGARAAGPGRAPAGAPPTPPRAVARPPAARGARPPACRADPRCRGGGEGPPGADRSGRRRGALPAQRGDPEGGRAGGGGSRRHEPARPTAGAAHQGLQGSRGPPRYFALTLDSALPGELSEPRRRRRTGSGPGPRSSRDGRGETRRQRTGRPAIDGSTATCHDLDSRRLSIEEED